ncbi:MAG: class I SAM-dependent rRNA methyltransferase [candidate division FCPU426 bacterium]
MKIETPVLRFRSTKEKRVSQGYLWAFRNELDFREKDHAPGSLVRVESAKGRPLGFGFLNTQANLCFRMLARPGEMDGEADLEGMIRERILRAIAWREERMPSSQARRLFFSEGDGLSGLIADQYRDALVLQFSSFAMDRHRDLVLETFKKVLKLRVVVERSEGGSRLKEGLEPKTGVLWSDGSLDEATLSHHPIEDGGLKFELDLLKGQKTGFFIDQRDTRALVASLAKGKTCLDMFCHTGALALSLAKGGAASVLGVDESEAALKLAARNAELNGLKATFEASDAFKSLRAMSDQGRSFDLVVLDPPSMTSNRASLGDALRGYKELNLRALKLLPAGGILVSCSCTQAVSEDDFLTTIQSAAVDAGARIQELFRLGQPEDHPRHPAMPETRYLKVRVFRKI